MKIHNRGCFLPPNGGLIAKILLLVSLLATSTDALADSPCGPTYPTDIKCMPGATAGETLEMFGEAKTTPIFFRLDKDALKEAFSRAVERSPWSMDGWREGHEPSGVRYRTSISKQQESIGVSIYAVSGGAVLQITVFEE